MFFEIATFFLFVLVVYMFEKQLSQKRILANLIKHLNNINQEVAHTTLVSDQNKQDILIIKDALSIHKKEMA